MKSSNWFTRLGLLTGIGIIAIFAFAMGMVVAPVPTTAQNNGSGTLTTIEQVFADIYNQVSPSVVSIEVDQLINNQFVPVSTGSGFVIDRQGHIVTNFHVIDDADRIAINFFDGTITRAEIVGTDPAADLAVLRVNLSANQLSPVTFANSDSLAIGQTAVAIGSPFGERWTMTTGIVSALDRELQGFTSFVIGSVIQTDTAINPGNSGGPLLNLNGEVIGVNSQIISEDRTFSGVGFAIPSNLVTRVSDELIREGQVTYSYLGMDGENVSIDFIEFYNLPNDLRGVIVTGVASNTPASNGGLRPNTNNSVDVITAVNGIQVFNLSMLSGYLATNTVPGQSTRFTVFRDGREVTLDIVLGER